MDFKEDIRICEERAETEFGTKIDCLATILSAREIGWVRVAEDPTAEGDELFVLFRF